MPKLRRFSGENLHRIREQRRILQDDLAHQLRRRGFGTTQATVSRWENGQEPRAHVIGALADILGVTVDELYGDAEEEEDSLSGSAAEQEFLAAIEALIEERIREITEGLAR